MEGSCWMDYLSIWLPVSHYTVTNAGLPAILSQSLEGCGSGVGGVNAGWSTCLSACLSGLPACLPVLGRAQVGDDGVVLDGLVQHQSHESGSVGHGRPQVPLLLEQLVQLVPLADRQAQRETDSCGEDRTVTPGTSYRWWWSCSITTRTLSRSTSARRSFSQQ